MHHSSVGLLASPFAGQAAAALCCDTHFIILAVLLASWGAAQALGDLPQAHLKCKLVTARVEAAALLLEALHWGPA